MCQSAIFICYCYYSDVPNNCAAKPYCFFQIFQPTRSYSILHVYLFWVKCPTYTFISSYTIIVFFCANVHTFINFEFLSNKSCNFHIFFERYSGKFKKLQKNLQKNWEISKNMEHFWKKTIKIGSKRLYLNDYSVLHVY